MKRLPGFVLGVGLAFPPGTSLAQSATRGVIDGVVIDTNLVGLAGATVSILGSGVTVSTGDNGRFRITGLLGGNYILAVRRLGYIPVAVGMALAVADTLRPSFALRRVVTALDTMIVTAQSPTGRLDEFEQRRSKGEGHFITADEIDKRGSIFVADILRTVPSVGIAERGPTVKIAVSNRLTNRICPFQLFLDGIPLPTLTNLDNLPPPKDLAGIEIYSGAATIPLQYKFGDTFCGVILLWTKRGG